MNIFFKENPKCLSIFSVDSIPPTSPHCQHLFLAFQPFLLSLVCNRMVIILVNGCALFDRQLCRKSCVDVNVFFEMVTIHMGHILATKSGILAQSQDLVTWLLRSHHQYASSLPNQAILTQPLVIWGHVLANSYLGIMPCGEVWHLLSATFTVLYHSYIFYGFGSYFLQSMFLTAYVFLHVPILNAHMPTCIQPHYIQPITWIGTISAPST